MLLTTPLLFELGDVVIEFVQMLALESKLFFEFLQGFHLLLADEHVLGYFAAGGEGITVV
jgi:hypothetical protein